MIGALSIFYSVLSVCLFVGCRHAGPQALPAPRLRIGAAEVDITPPVGYRMAGCFNERLSTRIHDPLHAKAIILQQGRPEPRPFDDTVNHAPRRKDILSIAEKKLAVANALRYFPPRHHATLAPEFYQELVTYGRIYMYRFRPTYDMVARSIHEYPHRSLQAAAIMLMIQNNLDPAVAQHRTNSSPTAATARSSRTGRSTC